MLEEDQIVSIDYCFFKKVLQLFFFMLIRLSKLQLTCSFFFLLVIVTRDDLISLEFCEWKYMFLIECLNKWILWQIIFMSFVTGNQDASQIHNRPLKTTIRIFQFYLLRICVKTGIGICTMLQMRTNPEACKCSPANSYTDGGR